MKNISVKTFRRIVTTAVVVILSVHILIASALTFLQGEITFGKSKFARVYKYFVHLGPFYREESIQSSPHFTVIHNGESKDLIQSYADEYRDKPWKINRLALRDYVDRTSQKFFTTNYYSERRMERSPGFRKLMRLSQQAHPDIKQGDSISWVYYNRWYVYQEKTWVNDTIFQYSFAWKGKTYGK